MNGTALYRAPVEAGTSEERAEEAADSVVYAREGATKADIAALEVAMEQNFRAMTFRLIGAMFAVQALMLAALQFTGPAWPLVPLGAPGQGRRKSRG